MLAHQVSTNSSHGSVTRSAKISNLGMFIVAQGIHRNALITAILRQLLVHHAVGQNQKLYFCRIIDTYYPLASN